jgi:hypothetical protein
MSQMQKVTMNLTEHDVENAEHLSLSYVLVTMLKRLVLHLVLLVRLVIYWVTIMSLSFVIKMVTCKKLFFFFLCLPSLKPFVIMNGGRLH